MKSMQIVVEDIDGIPAKASVVVCDQCNQGWFIVFTIDGQNHPHLQCVVCKTSYCSGGECKD